MTDTAVPAVQAEPTPFTSRFEIDQLVTLRLAHVELPARVLAVAFLAGKVLYTLAVYTGWLEPDLANQYGLTDSIGWDDDGEEYIRVPNIDSIFVEPYDEAEEPAVELPLMAKITARLDNHKRVETARKAKSGVTIKAEIYCNNEDTARTVSNWLSAVAHNCAVGHSATVAAFFDGDGADFIEVKGLPENDGADQARAGFVGGDGLMLHVGPYSAQAYSTGYAEVDGETIETVRKRTVWPPEKVEK